MTDNIDLRFVVTSDGHWGFANGDDGYEAAHEETINKIHAVHEEREIDFLVHNGDLVEDVVEYHQQVIKNYFDELPDGVDWYPVFGNHDWATEEEWEELYGHGKQLTFEYADVGFIIVNSADPRDFEGPYTPPDPDFVEESIDNFSDKEGIFVFCHVPPAGWEDDPGVTDQFRRDEVTAVFLGHRHDRNYPVSNSGVQYYYVCAIGDDSVPERGFRVVDIDLSV